MGYVLAGLVVFVVVLVLAGTVYQSIGTASDSRKYPPPGQLVDVGEHKMHIHCTGEGSPTVVMDIGIGWFSLIWSFVQPEVAKFRRVCTYDRAGYAWSDPNPTPRNSQQLVQELHTLLTNAGIKGPYVLVGHSLGGLNVRLFASHYPSEVVGIVLVDAVHEETYSRLPEFRKTMTANLRLFRILSMASRLGLLRLFMGLKRFDIAPKFVWKLPSEIQPVVLAQFLPKTFDAAAAEAVSLKRSAEQIQVTAALNDIPLVVLSHGVNMFSNLSDEETQRAEPTWQELQAELASLSSKGTLIIAENSSHDIHTDQPQLVIESIHQVVEAARHG